MQHVCMHSLPLLTFPPWQSQMPCVHGRSRWRPCLGWDLPRAHDQAHASMQSAPYHPLSLTSEVCLPSVAGRCPPLLPCMICPHPCLGPYRMMAATGAVDTEDEGGGVMTWRTAISRQTALLSSGA